MQVLTARLIFAVLLIEALYMHCEFPMVLCNFARLQLF